MNNVAHTCPGCRTTYTISADPELQPLTCPHCNFPIRQMRDCIASIFAIEYNERLNLR